MSLALAIPVLETERQTPRGPRESVVPVMETSGNSPRSQFMGGPFDRFGAWRVMSGFGHWAFRGYGYRSVDRRTDGAFVGRVGAILVPDAAEPELAHHVSDGDKGPGHAAEAMLGLAPLASFIDPENLHSVALAPRVGAERESLRRRRPCDPCLASPQGRGGMMFAHLPRDARSEKLSFESFSAPKIFRTKNLLAEGSA